jgi:peptidoglycan/LPS O-acetylase OafA/YrhL
MTTAPTPSASLQESHADGSPRRILGKIDALDGIRGMAVLLIVVHHLPVAVPWLLFNYRPTKGGGFGVDAFFVLSGFLITAILLRDQAHGGKVRFGVFYRRRAMRLLPALVFFLAIFLLYEWTTDLPGAHEPSSALSILFYYSNTGLRRLSMSPGLGNFWSLALEEQFYLLWPVCLALFLGARRRTGTVVVLLVGAIIAVTVHRAIMWNHGANWPRLYSRLDTRADALLVGCLLAQLWVRNKLPKRGIQTVGWIALVFYLYLVRVGASNDFLYRGGFTLIALSVGMIMLAVLESPWPFARVFRLWPLRALGRVSYGLYIWHLAVFTAVLRYGRWWAPVVQAIVALALAGAATAISWIFVERPFLRWKDRLSDHPKEVVGATPTDAPVRRAAYKHRAVAAPK